MEHWKKFNKGAFGVIYKPKVNAPEIFRGKVMKVSFGDDLIREATMQEKAHACFPDLVPKIYESGSNYIIMEEAEGETLDSIIESDPRLGQRVYNRMVNALRDFHDICKIGHFDAHTDNVIYDKKRDKLSIIDWGFARDLPKGVITKDIMLRLYWKAVAESTKHPGWASSNTNFPKRAKRDIYLGYATEIAPYAKNKTASYNQIIEIIKKNKRVPITNFKFLKHLSNNNSISNNPIRYYAGKSDYEAVKNYVNAGFSVKEGNPLHAAILAKNYKIINLLLSSGARLNDVDASLGTPLHAAIDTRNNNMVRYILRLGALPGLRDAKGRSSIQYAKDKGYPFLASSLKKHKVSLKSFNRR